MSAFTEYDSIIACSSCSKSNSAIALIRISGFYDISIFNNFFSIDLKTIKPRYSNYCSIVDHGKLIDSIVLTYFKGPNSYNGENILELAVHGNILNIDRIIKQFIDSGLCRAARAGEFTMRALKNKKMSLSQVEGLDTFLNATSTNLLDSGLSSLQGALFQKYISLYESFKLLKASVELSIDFYEDVGEQIASNEIQKRLSEFIRPLSELHDKLKTPLSTLLTPSIVLFGRPNAGKSSLFNALTKSSRAIVSEIPGTTRDYLTEFIFIDGVHYQLVDTAGLRDSDNEIEAIGIDKAREVISQAFYRILVVNPFDKEIEQFHDYDLLIFTHKDRPLFSEKVEQFLSMHKVQSTNILFINALNGDVESSGPIGPDYESGSIEPQENISGPIEPQENIGPIEPNESGPIGPNTELGPIEPFSKSGPIGPQDSSGSIEPKFNNGPIEPRQNNKASNIEYLEFLISRKYKELVVGEQISAPRQRQVLSDVYSLTDDFKNLILQENDVAIISSELNLIGLKLEELIGYIAPDEILNSIFDNFCIGK